MMKSLTYVLLTLSIVVGACAEKEQIDIRKVKKQTVSVDTDDVAVKRQFAAMVDYHNREVGFEMMEFVDDQTQADMLIEFEDGLKERTGETAVVSEGDTRNTLVLDKTTYMTNSYPTNYGYPQGGYGNPGYTAGAGYGAPGYGYNPGYGYGNGYGGYGYDYYNTGYDNTYGANYQGAPYQGYGPAANGYGAGYGNAGYGNAGYGNAGYGNAGYGNAGYGAYPQPYYGGGLYNVLLYAANIGLQVYFYNQQIELQEKYLDIYAQQYQNPYPGQYYANPQYRNQYYQYVRDQYSNTYPNATPYGGSNQYYLAPESNNSSDAVVCTGDNWTSCCSGFTAEYYRNLVYCEDPRYNPNAVRP